MIKSQSPQIACLFILTGILLPILCIPFINGNVENVGQLSNMASMEIIIKKGAWVEKVVFRDFQDMDDWSKSGLSIEEWTKRKPPSHWEGRIAFPFKHAITLSTLLIFSGGGVLLVTTATSKKKGNALKIIGIFFLTLVAYILAKDILKYSEARLIVLPFISVMGFAGMLHAWTRKK